MQLSGKKTSTTEPDVTSKVQEEGLQKGDATLADNNVLGLLQVYFTCIFDGCFTTNRNEATPGTTWLPSSFRE
jgi:hypothetical protein